MTGRHHLRTAAIDTYLGRSVLHPEEVTLPQLLQSAGYATGLFGKWHLGDHVPCRPFDKGFDRAIWHPGGGLGQPCDVPGNTYFDPMLDNNGHPFQSRGYCTDVFTDLALQFIVEQQNAQPWFCYLAYNAPHAPFQVPENWVEPFRQAGLPEVWARLYAMVQNIDTNVGRILHHLKRSGLEENTLVIFTSDHGPCGSARWQGRDRFNAGLREKKGTVYEGGIRVPCFIRWPNQIPAGKTMKVTTAPFDLLPTLCAVAGVEPPRDRILDGLNLLPTLQKPQDETSAPLQDRRVIMQWHRGNRPVKYRNYAIIHRNYKLMQPTEEDEPELYDLDTDPGEERNLATKDPTRVRTLREAYGAWFDEVCAERGEATFDPIPIPLGDDRQPHVRLTHQDWRLGDDEPQGWNCRFPGDWLVDVVQSKPFEMKIWKAPEIHQPYVLQIQLGDWEFQRQIEKPEEIEVFLNQPLPAGSGFLRVRLHCEGISYGPLRVEIAASESKTMDDSSKRSFPQ